MAVGARPVLSFPVWSVGQISDSAGENSPAGPIFVGDDVAFKNAIFINRLFNSPKSDPSFNIWRIHFKTTLNMWKAGSKFILSHLFYYFSNPGYLQNTNPGYLQKPAPTNSRSITGRYRKPVTAGNNIGFIVVHYRPFSIYFGFLGERRPTYMDGTDFRRCTYVHILSYILR